MRIVLAVASNDPALRSYLVTNRNSVVPPEIAGSGYFGGKGARFSVRVFALTSTTTEDELGLWLRALSKDADGLVVLIDEAHRPLARSFEDAYFIANWPSYPGKVLLNQVRATIAPVLRHFAAYCVRFDKLNTQRVLLLPLEIFLATELVALRARMTADKMNPGLGQELDEIIASIVRQRARPKTKQRYKTVYFVDDRPLWYRYGPERHAVVQTTKPPHEEKCWHLSRFRFGRLYDEGLHHNVDDDSDPTTVFGSFTTCHGAVFSASGESHLNIFPNGYI